MEHQTAILLFANSSAEEIRKKPLLKSAGLFDELNRLTLSTVKKTGIPYYHYSEKEQQGASFGERFANAIAAVFELGYDQVIAIGNDSPQLTSISIGKAAEAISRDRFVIGPSLDGGFYLLGLHKEHFNRQAFLALAWQTKELRADLLELLSKKAFTSYSLPPLRDLDTRQDLVLCYRQGHLLPTSVFRLIQLLLSAGKQLISYLQPRAISISLEAPLNKGSPSILHFPF